VILTIGHSSRTLEAFLDLLRAHGVERLIDVRRYPGSRRHPHFGQVVLSASLAAAGVAYQHEPDLGGRRRPLPDSPNGFWQNEQFRAYADYMASQAFEAAMGRVLARATHERVVLMCAEAVPWRCHRQLIADWLVARGHEVGHILSLDRAPPHELCPGARFEDGRLTYPGSPLDL
jgi:uncharacterized protein (DUF488 family)